MKRKFSGRKLNRLTRQVLLIALCLACVFEASPIVINAKNETGYTWTRAKSGADLKKATHGDTCDKSLSSNSDWYRVLIVYGDGTYFLSGNSFDGDDLMCRPVAATYGIKAGGKMSSTIEDSFSTRTGLDTPFLKYSGYDGDNGCDTYYVAFQDGTDKTKVGSNCLCGTISWYGCKWAAIYSFHYCSAGRSNPDADCHKKGGAANMSSRAYYSFAFNGEGKANIFCNLEGVKDTHWEWHGSNLSTDTSTDDRFIVYIGSPFEASSFSVDKDVNVASPSDSNVTVWDAAVINAGVTVHVNEGAVLVIKGSTINNGVIIVDGGTLIVSGVLDSDIEGLSQLQKIKVPNPSKPTETITKEVCPGYIYMMNHAQLIVERSGTLLTRYKANHVGGYADSIEMVNSTAIVEGIVVLTEGVNMVKNSSFRVAPGGALVCCVRPISTVGEGSYNADYIYKNSDTVHFDDLVTNNFGPNITKNSNGKTLVEDDFEKRTFCSLRVCDNSSFICYGCFFAPDYCYAGPVLWGKNEVESGTTLFSNGYYADTPLWKNIYQSLGSAMDAW